MPSKILPLMVVAALLGANSYASTIVLPIGFDSTEGSNGLNTPLRDSARTLQIAFDPTELMGLPPGSRITGMRFRVNGLDDTWPASDLSWNNYDIIFSEALFYPVSLSSSFDDNIGFDAVTVRSGPLTIPANAFPGGSSPNHFGYLFSFTNSYVYQGGTLLITIRHDGNGMDYAFVDSTASGFGVTHASLGADSYDALTANLTLSSTPILALDYQAIPEPSTIVLTAGGVLIALLGRRRNG